MFGLTDETDISAVRFIVLAIGLKLMPLMLVWVAGSGTVCRLPLAAIVATPAPVPVLARCRRPEPVLAREPATP